MSPTHIESILKDALANSKHDAACRFQLSKVRNNLPPNHPRHAQVVNIAECNCWRRKATRMLRALKSVARSQDFTETSASVS